MILKRLHNFRILSGMLFLLIGAAPRAQASDASLDMSKVYISDEYTTDRVRLFIAPEYTMMSGTTGEALTGYGGNGALMVGFAERWQIGLAFRQDFAGSGISALFSEIDIRAYYALSGTTVRRSRSVMVNGDEIYHSDVLSNGGLRLGFYLSQFLFNAGNAVVPLSGIGGGLHYEFPSDGNINWLIGVRADYITSGELSFIPLQACFGISFWI